MNLVAFGKRNFYIDVNYFFLLLSLGPPLQDHDSRTTPPGSQLQDHDSRTMTPGPRLQDCDFRIMTQTIVIINQGFLERKNPDSAKPENRLALVVLAKLPKMDLV